MALGFAPAVFEEFEAHIVTLLQNTLPGVWLTTLIDDAFNAFLDEKTNELAAFIAESSLSLAVFPGVSDASARSSQIVAEAISTGDEALRLKNQLARLPHAPLAAPPTTPPAPPSATVATAANGATPGGGNPSRNRNKRKNGQASAPAASSTTAPAATAPIALSPTGRAPRPGACTQIVKANAAGTLLKIGKTDVFDAEKLVEDVRARSPSFNIDLKRDILMLAAWLAEGNSDQRARFVPANCEKRFIEYPFPSFDKQVYKTSKNF